MEEVVRMKKKKKKKKTRDKVLPFLHLARSHSYSSFLCIHTLTTFQSSQVTGKQENKNQQPEHQIKNVTKEKEKKEEVHNSSDPNFFMVPLPLPSPLSLLSVIVACSLWCKMKRYAIKEYISG